MLLFSFQPSWQMLLDNKQMEAWLLSFHTILIIFPLKHILKSVRGELRVLSLVRWRTILMPCIIFGFIFDFSRCQPASGQPGLQVRSQETGSQQLLVVSIQSPNIYRPGLRHLPWKTYDFSPRDCQFLPGRSTASTRLAHNFY